MKVTDLVSCISLSILVLLLFSISAQATEYREVNTTVEAEDILKHIENGEDINLENCRIVGELNARNIKLETVPDHDSQCKQSYDGYYYLNSGGGELQVIKSYICIRHSIFENSVDFSNVKFNNSVDFSYSTFNSSANFNSANFGSYSNFFEVTFNSSADFYGAIFNSSSNFFGVTFNDFSDFIWTTFSSDTDFSFSSFNSDTDFSFTSFNSSSIFTGVIFKNSAFFNSVSFANPSNFQILLPDTSENIITDGKTCEFFREYYKNNARFEDADNIYYNYRINSQDNKNILTLSKWIDILSWFTCGYGVKPFNAFLFGSLIIFLFSLIYANPISFNKNSNQIIPLIFSFKNPGIINNDQTKKASLLDIFYYSICRFTFMSYENWYPKDNFRIFAILEGVIGWATLGIFMATLTAVMIRY